MYIIACKAHFWHLLGLGQVGHYQGKPVGVVGPSTGALARPWWGRSMPKGNQWECWDPGLGPDVVRLPVHLPPQMHPCTPNAPWHSHAPQCLLMTPIPCLPLSTYTPCQAPNAPLMPPTPLMAPNALWHPPIPPDTPTLPRSPQCPLMPPIPCCSWAPTLPASPQCTPDTLTPQWTPDTPRSPQCSDDAYTPTSPWVPTLPASPQCTLASPTLCRIPQCPWCHLWPCQPLNTYTPCQPLVHPDTPW